MLVSKSYFYFFRIMTVKSKRSSRVVKSVRRESPQKSGFLEFADYTSKDYVYLGAIFFLSIFLLLVLIRSNSQAKELSSVESYAELSQLEIEKLNKNLKKQQSKLAYMNQAYNTLKDGQKVLMENVNMMKIIYKNTETGEMVNILAIDEAYRSRITKNSRYQPYEFKF